MPNVTNPGVIKLLVLNYIINNRVKSTALVKTGYSESYANGTKGMNLFERSDVKAELRKQEIELLKKTGLTKEDFAYDLEEAKRLGMRINQPSAAVSAITTNMRLHGMDQVEGRKDATVIVINPPNNVKSVINERNDDEVQEL